MGLPKIKLGTLTSMAGGGCDTAIMNSCHVEMRGMRGEQYILTKLTKLHCRITQCHEGYQPALEETKINKKSQRDGPENPNLTFLHDELDPLV